MTIFIDMDKKSAFIVQFLRYLSKKTDFKKITFDQYKEISKVGVFKSLSNNYGLYEFYDANVSPDVKWEEFDLTPYVYNFYQKIKSIYEGKIAPNQVFSDPLDEHFELGRSNRSDYVVFYEDTIHIVFQNQYSDFLLDLINLDDNDLSYYRGARHNGDCYEVDWSDDELIYMFGTMDFDCVDKLREITIALGDMELASEINYQRHLSDSSSAKLIRMFQKFFGDKYLDKLFDEYRRAVSQASCESIIKAYNDHFNTDVNLYDDYTVEVTYDFFLKFLEKYPRIQSFSDLKGYSFIEHSTDISQAMYEYEVNHGDLNREYYYVLENMLEDIMEDEDTSKVVGSVKEFENLMKQLKFKYEIGDRAYKKVFGTEGERKIFYIALENIDFKNKKVVLLQLIEKSGERHPVSTKYKIPFSEISDYVMTEKLHESIKKLIRKYLIKN